MKINCSARCFLKCSNVPCLFSEIARYEGRVKQIFLTSVEASRQNRAHIEFTGMEDVRGLIANKDDHDTIKVIMDHRGVPPQKVHNKKSMLETAVRKSAERNATTEVGSKKILETIKPASNKRDTRKEVEKLLGHTSSDEYFPVDTICPHVGLRKVPYIRLNNSLPKNKYCVRREPSVQECQKATRDYEVESPALRCEGPMEKDLCTITEKYRTNANAQVNVRCDIGRCGNPVYVVSLDPKTGQLEEQQKWQKFTSKTEIEGNLPSVIIRNSKKGLNFCLVQCLRNNTSQLIRTVLSFPPIIEVTNSHTQKPVNLDINVVVLNSVSRAHFYRSLPETVGTIRNVVYDNSIPASALDFEFLQNFGPDMALDLRIPSSGKNGETPTENSEISTLFAELKKLGYHNILQTDQCWYDKDAITIDLRSKMETEEVTEKFRKHWMYFQSMATKYIDDTGMTYFACEAKTKYSVPNQVDGESSKASCFNGRYFFNFIFDHKDKTRQAKRASKAKTPIFSYTHLTLSRDKLGAGIKQIDKQLSTFLNNMAREQNAVTIVTSDHGPRSTKYSLDSVEGRYEIYDPILIMIIPKDVAAQFGKQQMEALKKNQHRLVSPSDLHNTLVSMANLGQKHDHQGLLAEIPENRTCEDIGVDVGTLCKCRGWETWFPDNDPRFAWVAEFALGELNNKLQDSTKKLSFGNKRNKRCQRLLGYGFEKIYHSKKSDPFVLSLDLIVHPGRQVLETHVQLPKYFPSEGYKTISPSQAKEDLIKIIRFRRAGHSQGFLTLSKSGVPFECLNDFHVLQNNIQKRGDYLAADGKYNVDILKMAHQSKHFGSRPIIQVLDRRDKCLLLITRMHSSSTLAFEASNICVDKTFVMKVDMINRGGEHAFITRSLPMIVHLAPETNRFLLSAYQPRGEINWKPKVAFKMVKT